MCQKNEWIFEEWVIPITIAIIIVILILLGDQV
jgi:hypothetical protein